MSGDIAVGRPGYGGKGSAGVCPPPQMGWAALLGLDSECVGLSWASVLVLRM